MSCRATAALDSLIDGVCAVPELLVDLEDVIVAVVLTAACEDRESAAILFDLVAEKVRFTLRQLEDA